MASIVKPAQARRRLLLARIPTFSNNTFALANQDCGLALSSGGAVDGFQRMLLAQSGGRSGGLLSGVHRQRAVCLGDLTRLSSTDLSFQYSTPLFTRPVFPRSENFRRLCSATPASAGGHRILLSFGTQEPLVVPSAYRIYLTSSDGSGVADLTAAISGVLDDPSTPDRVPDDLPRHPLPSLRCVAALDRTAVANFIILERRRCYDCN